MKQLIQDPPYNIRQLCEEQFGISQTNVVWTFKDTVYNPHNGHIDGALLVHEATHADQQGDEPVKWWVTYLEDPEFRFKQELEAYRNQYAFIKRSVKDRNQLAKLLHVLATDLSSSLYGNVCTLQEARKLIRLDNKNHDIL